MKKIILATIALLWTASLLANNTYIYGVPNVSLNENDCGKVLGFSATVQNSGVVPTCPGGPLGCYTWKIFKNGELDATVFTVNPSMAYNFNFPVTGQIKITVTFSRTLSNGCSEIYIEEGNYYTSFSFRHLVLENDSVFFKGVDQKLHLLVRSNGVWGNAPLADMAPANVEGHLVKSGPSVFYRGTDRKIHRQIYDGGGWRYENLSDSAGAPNHVQGFLTGKRSDEIFYNGFDCRIYRINQVAGNWFFSDPAPLAPSNSVGHLEMDNDRNIYYKGADRKISRLDFNGANWTYLNFSDFVGAPADVAGNIQSQNYGLIYKGANENIVEIRNDSHNVITPGSVTIDATYGMAEDSVLYLSKSYNGTSGQILFWSPVNSTTTFEYINPWVASPQGSDLHHVDLEGNQQSGYKLSFIGNDNYVYFYERLNGVWAGGKINLNSIPIADFCNTIYNKREIEQSDGGIMPSVEVGPNPFDSEVSIRVYLPEPANVSFRMIDSYGKIIWDKGVEARPKGEFSVSINGAGQIVPGIYFVQVWIEGRPGSTEESSKDLTLKMSKKHNP